jgi:hypothetical protein
VKKLDGKQKNEYFKEYYLKNKERIQARNKAKYHADRSDPEKLKEHRKRATEATRRWRARHPDKVKQKRKDAYNNRKQRAMDKLGGAICIRCGCDELGFLEFNHKNGGGCKEWRTAKKSMADRILSGERSTEDIEILCRLCNAHHFLESKNVNANRFTVVWK